MPNRKTDINNYGGFSTDMIGENYNYPNGYPSGDEMSYQLEYMNYEQRTRLSGTGINFKIGVTLRPVKWWRVGIAYHTAGNAVQITQ